MAWCHYLSQYWPRSLSPYDLTRPQWVMGYITQGFINGQHFAKYIFMNENHEMIQISLKYVAKDSIDNMSSVLVMAWCLTTVRILGPLWPRTWPWIYKVKCWNSHISGTGGLTDMVQESIGCDPLWPWTLISPLIFTSDFKVKFWNTVSQEWECRLGCESIRCWTYTIRPWP